MKITKSKEKQSHPFASHIPNGVWWNVFRASFDDKNIPAEGKRFNELIREDLPTDPRQALFVLMIRYPDLPPSEYMPFARDTLALSNDVMFQMSAAMGRLDALKWLKVQAPEELNAMIRAENYYAFRWAAAGGHLDILEWLKAKAPGELNAMIKARDYLAFRLVAAGGHLNILEWLKAQAPGKLNAMIKAEDYEAFRLAALNGHLDTVNWLLQQPLRFAYAESHVQEYGEKYVNPFVAQTLAALHQAHDAMRLENPNAVFDIDNPEKAELCFYILRNIIRRNDRNLDDELQFLLDIPAVKTLAHQTVNEGQPNELLRLAMSAGNAQASARLLNIEAVRILAEQHNFYQAEMRGGVDLSALARDRESSMTALTPGEQARLKTAIDHYTPFIKSAGAVNLLDALRHDLIARYEASPAFIMIGEEKVILPVSWEAFNALGLEGAQRTMALEAYYQNKTHTVLRYLSKPNRFMADNASYVYVDDKDPTARYSTFEEYTPLIVLCWLGAMDETIAPIEKHTLEGRLDHFIDELAHLGRAHNWDKSRIKKDKDGHPVLDPKTGEPVKEEYDDLAGDKPSCFSGVKRRLFQSVVGHAFFTVLTEDNLKLELRGFVRKHFKKVYSADAHKQAYETALDAIIEGETVPKNAYNTLSALNVSKQDIGAFVNKMMQKYGEQAKAFVPYIWMRFQLPENNEAASNRYTHLFNFFEHANLKQLVDKLNAGKSSEKTPTLFSASAQPSEPSSHVQPQEESSHLRPE